MVCYWECLLVILDWSRYSLYININYNYNKEVNNTVAISKGVTGYNVKVQLVKALNEIKEALLEHRLQSVTLKYDRAIGKLEYQLVQKS